MSKRELAAVKERIRQINKELIRELRATNNLTQTELAQQVGINRSLISQYESGDREPSLLSLVKLANYSNVSVDYLLGREGIQKYDLTEVEEKIIRVWRKLPEGCEMTIKKEGAKEKLDRVQIAVKQDVKI